ncbi:zinc finger BED domain-containing protein 5-like [Watersipora subatra]|uniref:zinc finger BED domain-containing protein 5-like n=1 Tax=Watersipora subatra TaxID=2589382 RepID=UPI00355AE201
MSMHSRRHMTWSHDTQASILCPSSHGFNPYDFGMGDSRISSRQGSDSFLFILASLYVGAPARLYHEWSSSQLLCSSIARLQPIFAVANVNRHYTQNHPDYDGRFSSGTARRQEQLDRLTRQANGQMAMMKRATSLQQRAATAGYELDIQQAVQSVPLSRNTCARRIEAIANHVTEGVIYNLNRCELFSVAVDESTDINDVAQLSVLVLYYLNNKFSEDLAAVIPLTECTTGENMYQAFKAYMDSHKVSMHKIISVATDSAPAMVGVYFGFVNPLKDNNSQMIAFHCIIHRSILCAQLKDEYGGLLLDIMKLINFLRSKSSLQHRQLRTFLQESDSQYAKLLVHNNVRHISFGKPKLITFLMFRQVWQN